jgi:hypothetical protein
MLLERYGGSAAGAFAFMAGRTALDQEGLAETSEGIRVEPPTFSPAP